MAEEQICILAGELKQKQQTMQSIVTELTDVLFELWEEAVLLQGMWKGAAAEKFLNSFQWEWEQASQVRTAIGKITELLLLAEKKFEESEEKVENLLEGEGIFGGFW